MKRLLKKGASFFLFLIQIFFYLRSIVLKYILLNIKVKIFKEIIFWI